MIYLLKPKYNAIYQCKNETEVNEVMNSEGGYFIWFDHPLTDEEKQKAFNEYYQ